VPGTICPWTAKVEFEHERVLRGARLVAGGIDTREHRNLVPALRQANGVRASYLCHAVRLRRKSKARD